jgi:hypothetical protein
MSTIGKDIARGCGRATVIRIIAVAIGLPLGCALIGLLLLLTNALASTPWLLAIAVLATLLVFTVAIVAAIAIPVYLRKQRLDAVFEPLGLTGGTYNTFFRQYHGTVQDQQVDVYLSRGPLLEMETSTSLQTRLGVTGAHGDTRFLAGLAGKQPLSLSSPDLQDLTVFAPDEDWARSLLDNEHAAELLRQLIAQTDSWTRQQIVLRPGTFKLMLSGSTRLFGFDLTPEQVGQHLGDLLRLARIAERLPSPHVTAELTSAEELANRVRKANPYLALWTGLGTLVGLLVISGIITALVLLLDRLQG